MKLKIFFSLFLAFSTFSLSAQNTNNKIIHSWAYQAGLAAMPAFITDEGHQDQLFFYDFGLNYRFRYNFLEKNDNNAVSFSLTPEVGAYLGGFSQRSGEAIGLGGLNLAIGVNYNMGAGATFNSDKDKGVAFSGGLDLTYTPVLFVSDDNFEPKKFYAAPYLEIGYRYWGKKSNALQEFFLRINIMSNDDEITEFDPVTPIIVRGGLVKFINY